jgi:hypothetical protein
MRSDILITIAQLDHQFDIQHFFGLGQLQESISRLASQAWEITLSTYCVGLPKYCVRYDAPDGVGKCRFRAPFPGSASR